MVSKKMLYMYFGNICSPKHIKYNAVISLMFVSEEEEILNRWKHILLVIFTAIFLTKAGKRSNIALGAVLHPFSVSICWYQGAVRAYLLCITNIIAYNFQKL